MSVLSLFDTLLALQTHAAKAWGVRQSLVTPIFPEPQGQRISVRYYAERYSVAGSEIRAIEDKNVNVWTHLDRTELARGARARIRDSMVMQQRATGLCGPISILMELARRNPGQYMKLVRELVQNGRMTCSNGSVINAEVELRQEPILVKNLAQVDWLLAATMRDDANLWEDVDDSANGLEAMTFWYAQCDWVKNVLGIANADYETCFNSGEVECMQKAEAALQNGGVSFFLIDANLIKDGVNDNEEEVWWQKSSHYELKKPSADGRNYHSKDDSFPPNHWVVYLGGLELKSNPQDDDPLRFKIWSWGSEYILTCTVDAFAEYLYAVVTGYD